MTQDTFRLALFECKLRRAHNPAMPDGECWEFCGSRDRDNYGKFWNGQRSVMAHRYSYEAHVGPIGPGLEVDHICCNRSCVRPSHLQAITHEENCLLRDFRRSLALLYRYRPDRDPRFLAA